MESLSQLFMTGIQENWFRGRILFIQTSMLNWKTLCSFFPNYLRGKSLPKLCIHANQTTSWKHGLIFELNLSDCKWQIQDISKLLTELDSDLELQYKGKADYKLHVKKGLSRIVISSSSSLEIVDHFKSQNPSCNWKIIARRSKQLLINHEFENQQKIEYSLGAIFGLLNSWKLQQIYYTSSGPVEKCQPLRCGKMVVPSYRPIGGVKTPYPPVVDVDSDDTDYNADDEDTDSKTD